MGVTWCLPSISAFGDRNDVEGQMAVISGLHDITGSFFSDIYILLDCEFLVAQRSNRTEDGDLEVSLTEVYSVHPTRPLQINPVARWSSKSGITWSEASFLDRRADMHGISSMLQ
jgi:hypothetical protein